MSHDRLLLYVSCGTSLEIVHFEVDRKTGKLARCGATRLPGAPPPADPDTAPPPASLRSNGAPLAISPGGDALYAAMRDPRFSVVSYRIDRQTGDLLQIGQAPITDLTPYIATDRTGRFLLGADYQSNQVWISRIEPDGAVTQLPMQQVEGLVTVHSVMLHPDNRLAFVGATGVSQVQIFAFDPESGHLGARGAAIGTSLDPDPTPRHLAISPDQRFLYCVNETSGIIDTFAIDAESGGLTLVHSLDPRPAESRHQPGLGADIHVSPNGRFLYCSERIGGTIAICAIDPDSGHLSLVEAVTIGSMPRSFAIDPAGRFLVAAAQGDGAIHVFAINDSDGRLVHLETHHASGPPIWVEFVDLGAARSV